MFKQPAKSLLASTLLVMLFGSVSVLQALASPPKQEDSNSDESYNLRGVFYLKDNVEASAMVARVSIMLIESVGSREVRLDHPFHSGDRFRFVVSSNHDGWLYILHRSLSGRAQQLWPQKGSEAGASQYQEVKAGQTYLIPPSPGIFVFDEEVGQEEFIVAIRSQETAPEIGSSPGMKTIGNIVIRGDPLSGGTFRGTYFDPGTDDPDPSLYFSAAPGDAATKAMVKFKLRHAK